MLLFPGDVDRSMWEIMVGKYNAIVYETSLNLGAPHFRGPCLAWGSKSMRVAQSNNPGYHVLHKAKDNHYCAYALEL